MRRNLSITTAAAALLVGTVFAAAQGVPRQAPAGSAPEIGAQGGAQGQGGTQVAPQEGQNKGKAQSKEPRTQGQGGQGQRETQSQPQGQREGGQPQQQGQQPRQQPQQGQQTPSRDNQNGQKGADSKSGGTQSGGVTLNVQQRTTIRNTVLKANNAPRVANVNFSINVGTVVPRSGVTLVALPPTLVEIYPDWSGYMYFIVGERIIIVEPDSHRIVAVLVV